MAAYAAVTRWSNMPKKKKKLLEDVEEKNLLAVADPQEQVAKDAEDTDDEKVDPAQVTTGVKKISDVQSKKKKKQNLDDLRTEIEQNFAAAVRADAPWMKEAKQDIDFALGEQWEEEDKQLLKGQNRPVMVFNKIKPLIQLVTGHLIQTKARIQAFPEGGEDETFTAVMDKAIDHIEKVSHLNFKLSYLFAGGERAGKNWIEFHVDYDDDPIFGQLKIPNLGPFKVFVDPQCIEYDLSDAGFGFKVLKLSKGRLKQRYPDKEKEISGVDDSLARIITNVENVRSGEDSDYGNSDTVPRGGQNETEKIDISDNMKEVTVIEYWKRDFVKRWFVYFVEDGAVEEFNSEEEVRAEIEARKRTVHSKLMKEHQAKAQKLADTKAFVNMAAKASGVTPPQDDMPMPEPPALESVNLEFAIRSRNVVRMKVAVIAGNEFMTDGLVDSPFEPEYSGFPFFRYIAEWAPEAEKPELRVQGIVRSLKDPQREKNKSRSQFLHILNTSANSGWIGDEDALSPTKWDELRDFGSTPGLTVRKKKNAALDRIHPVEPSFANSVREKAADDSFKEVSGLNADMLAMDDSANPSGKAIALRIRQAVTILQPSFENFRYTKILIGQFLYSIIPTLFDAAKLAKVLGEKFMRENSLTKDVLRAYLTMISDGKYNVQISEAGAPDTLREETFEDLTQLAQAGISMPPDLFIEFMNIPNKTEILSRVKEWAAMQIQAQAAKSGAGAKP